MGATISTHNGSKVCQEHNDREEKVVSKEAHIDPNRTHETWQHEKVSDAYKRLFEDARLEYNAKQSRPERQINNYYAEVCKDAKKHPAYEMIIGIYGKNKDGSYICSEKTGKEIMKEFVDGWKDRNPNLELIGAYYHADEDGEPHVHIDYIPVAHGYTRGMETQTGLVKALGEQGFEKKGKLTAQIQWEKRENEHLEKLCNARGISVDHPRLEGIKHRETELYKLDKYLEGHVEEIRGIMNSQDELVAETNKLEAQRDRANRQTERAMKRLERTLKKSIKEKGDDQGWTYNKKAYEAIRDIKADIKAEVEEISHTDREVAEAYSRADDARVRAEKMEAKRKEELEAQREEARKREEAYNKRVQVEANRQFEEFMREQFPRGTSRETRLEEYCSKLGMNNGKSVLENFNESERERKQQLHRSWGHER